MLLKNKKKNCKKIYYVWAENKVNTFSFLWPAQQRNIRRLHAKVFPGKTGTDKIMATM